MTAEPNHIEGRSRVIEALRSELVGPSPVGRPLDLSRPVAFATKEDSYGPWIDSSTGEEILQRDRPVKRYGAGVLYPPRMDAVDVVLSDTEPVETAGEVDASTAAPELLAPSATDEIETVATRRFGSTPAGDDFDLSTANAYRPSSMAVTFLVRLVDGAPLKVAASGGRYRTARVTIGTDERQWWARSPVALEATFSPSDLAVASPSLVEPAQSSSTGADDLDLRFRAFSRPWSDGRVLVTLALSNYTMSKGAPDTSALFQSAFRVTATSSVGEGLIEPYPPRDGAAPPSGSEEASFELLYRDARTYAIGHGCAADWEAPSVDARSSWVAAEAMPMVETPNITPDIERADGTPLRVSMAQLAGLDSKVQPLALLEEVVAAYEAWIERREAEVANLPHEHRATADAHMHDCRVALGRMRRGIALIAADENCESAFRLANEAILLQQLRGRKTPRDSGYSKDGKVFVTPPLDVPDWRTAGNRGWWRPFQIAFILTSVASVADGDDEDRETVELIWFPTGGGKTEAYLGLSAFALFLRRIKDPADAGVEILMRYTLRLLTSQQFQRAAALICAMEHLRLREGSLGDKPFSIGIWLGNEVTPGKMAQAKTALRKLNSTDKYAENLFALLRCPWCSARLGPLPHEVKLPKGSPRVIGYYESGGTVVFKCPDRTCEFRKGLPVHVIDEEIYEARPSMVIGTVDKFAMLAWNPEARSLFGIGPGGEREVSPPGTIIQDELHLISGPLGSIVGLYEPVIEELCTDRRNGRVVRPKIISSTATIRRYAEQVKALYGRERTILFPPRGLDAGDSFFASYARLEDGSLAPGRIYVGVNAPGLGSVQTSQVRTFSALLQAPVGMAPDERDPWWSLLIFFNSLRELGTSLSLLQSDIPDYLGVMKNRLGLEFKDLRFLKHVKELTSRLRSDEIPRAIDEMSVPAGNNEAIDVCLSSSIIEVGIDIDRLSLMAVFGQPKTTSQYIQVTGRVGRNWQERPGLVVTIFSASKPRDRSHFERFRTYHERLYAQVEPTSVTPFSPPVLDRALHAAVVSYVRQFGSTAQKPWPVPDALIGRAMDVLVHRAAIVDPTELATLKEVLAARLAEWRGWERTSWSSFGSDEKEQYPLLRRSGEWTPPAAARLSWPTPTSMRNVDAECRAEVTVRYAIENGTAGE